jgi:hypothetical protein
MRSSITDPDRLPRGIAVGKWWPIVVWHNAHERCNVQECADTAVAELIKCAWAHFEADIEGPTQSCKESPSLLEEREALPHAAWRLKAFQIQQLLDEYLQAWRRRQDAALGRGYDPEYEGLLRSGAKRGPPCDWPDPYDWVLRGRGSHLKEDFNFRDLFDHPLLYEYSKLGRFSEEEQAESVCDFRLSSDQTIGGRGSSEILSWILTDRPILKAPITHLIKACKTILICTPQLSGLALTSYTRAALFEKLPVLQQGHLGLLSIGPTPTLSARPLALHQEFLSSVQILHVQGECRSPNYPYNGNLDAGG